MLEIILAAIIILGSIAGASKSHAETPSGKPDSYDTCVVKVKKAYGPEEWPAVINTCEDSGDQHKINQCKTKRCTQDVVGL